MDIATVMWILGGAVTLIYALGGAVFKMLRDESKQQAELIRQKADSDRLDEAEARWQNELQQVRDGNEKLIDKLENRYDRELVALAERLSDQIKTSENNILNQLALLLRMVDKT